jgi:predicted nucleic acid-binding protein
VALILDTNALSAVADGEASVMELVGGADRVVVPVIVLGEYRFGIAQSRHRVSYEGWLRQWTAAVEILDIDDRSTHSYSTIALELKRKGTPIPTNDLWIAALCRQHSLPLVSRDKHFDSVPGLQRLGW